MKRGRKRNPFLIKSYAPKTYPYTRGRIYNYDFYQSEFGIYINLEWDEIRNLNKDIDVDSFALMIRKEFSIGDCNHNIPVRFTQEEFKNFKRTKIIEHNLNELPHTNI